MAPGRPVLRVAVEDVNVVQSPVIDADERVAAILLMLVDELPRNPVGKVRLSRLEKTTPSWIRLTSGMAKKLSRHPATRAMA